MLNNYDFNALFNSLTRFNSVFDFDSMFGFNSLFSPFYTHRKHAPVTTITGTEVTLGAGLSYKVKINGLSIHGNKGFEQVTIAPNVSGIKIDSSVESVTFKGVSFDANLLVSAQGSLAINSVTGNNLATLSLTPNHDETLSFSNAIGTVSLDSSGNGVFNLSEIQLDKNQNFTTNTNDVQIYGNTGEEKVTIAHNVTGVEISNLVETVVVDGSANDYSYAIQGGTVVLSNKNTGDDVAFIDVSNSSTGTQIQFADKTLSASWEKVDSFGWWSSWGVVVTDPTAPVTPTTISGGTNLQYSVDFSHANLGNYLTDVAANVKTALDNIGQYVSSKTTFNLQVLTEQTTPKTLAEANATMVSIANQTGTTQTTAFISESTSGIDSTLGMPDATLYINLANMEQMSFSGTPAADKYDLTSILTHEILHGLAFTGNLGTEDGIKTPFDSLVTMQNNVPVFTGSHAQAVNQNNPVPLEPESAGDGSAYYHVAVANDLMSGSIGKGEVRTLSPLDVAILQDVGLTIVGTPPSLSA